MPRKDTVTTSSNRPPWYALVGLWHAKQACMAPKLPLRLWYRRSLVPGSGLSGVVHVAGQADSAGAPIKIACRGCEMRRVCGMPCRCGGHQRVPPHHGAAHQQRNRADHHARHAALAQGKRAPAHHIVPRCLSLLICQAGQRLSTCMLLDLALNEGLQFACQLGSNRCTAT